MVQCRSRGVHVTLRPSDLLPRVSFILCKLLMSQATVCFSFLWGEARVQTVCFQLKPYPHAFLSSSSGRRALHPLLMIRGLTWTCPFLEGLSPSHTSWSGQTCSAVLSFHSMVLHFNSDSSHSDCVV